MPCFRRLLLLLFLAASIAVLLTAIIRLCFFTALLLGRDACWKNTYSIFLCLSYYHFSLRLFLMLLLHFTRDMHYNFGGGAAAAFFSTNYIPCWLRCCCCWCLCCMQHRYRSRERYRLLFLPTTFLSFTLRWFGRLSLLLFLAASISVL